MSHYTPSNDSERGEENRWRNKTVCYCCKFSTIESWENRSYHKMNVYKIELKRSVQAPAYITAMPEIVCHQLLWRLVVVCHVLTCSVKFCY